MSQSEGQKKRVEKGGLVDKDENGNKDIQQEKNSMKGTGNGRGMNNNSAEQDND